MKIAAITDDGKTISQHFGRASHYMVITIEDGRIAQREMRDKMGHAHFHAEGGEHQESHDGRHGFGPAADHRHVRMSETITDCEAILCRGMGMGAYQHMQACNIRPVITDISDIEEAVLAYATGEIVDHVEKLH